MRRILSILAAVLCFSAAAFAQAPEQTVSWSGSVSTLQDDLLEVRFTGKILEGWHTYSLRDQYSATEIAFEASEGCSLEGGPQEIGTPRRTASGELVFERRIVLVQQVRKTAPDAVLKGTITWNSCNDKMCAAPEGWTFEIPLVPSQAASLQEEPAVPVSGAAGSLWSLVLEAILWGLAMLLTPCVFPMVPMTVSYFIKGSASPAAGRFKAFMYGLFIVLLYTVPICLIIGLTRLIGGAAVTADIFNWLATHWLPNLVFFAVFLFFAASFFGAFELTLPSSLVNKSDKNADRSGLAGVFFMALTLVLVSFSCTGPIVGTVLIKSTQGQFWTPMVTMLAFSAAFALPFTLLALFPSVLKKLKSGTWLGRVKVVLGFIEVALAFKFLSIPDQTYHWGLLDREVYLAIWIVVFGLLGCYLMGWLRFQGEEPSEGIGLTRLGLGIAVFSFVVYMVPGLFGAPLKALSGYLPPMSTQDFVLAAYAGDTPKERAYARSGELEIPHRLPGTFSLSEALERAQAEGKKVFADFTGHGCTNCREMEARVWSDPQVQALLREHFIIASLYTDEKKYDAAPQDRIVTPEGKELVKMGKVNAYIARTRFGINAQPAYVILDTDGKQLTPVRGYDLSIDRFLDFLQSGLNASDGAVTP